MCFRGGSPEKIFPSTRKSARWRLPVRRGCLSAGSRASGGRPWRSSPRRPRGPRRGRLAPSMPRHSRLFLFFHDRPMRALPPRPSLARSDRQGLVLARCFPSPREAPPQRSTARVSPHWPGAGFPWSALAMHRPRSWPRAGPPTRRALLSWRPWPGICPRYHFAVQGCHSMGGSAGQWPTPLCALPRVFPGALPGAPGAQDLRYSAVRSECAMAW